MLTEMIWTFYTCNNFAIRFITAILKCRSKVVTRFLFHITWKDRNNFFKYLDKRIKTFSFLKFIWLPSAYFARWTKFQSGLFKFYSSIHVFKYVLPSLHYSYFFTKREECPCVLPYNIQHCLTYDTLANKESLFWNDDIFYMKFTLLYVQYWII